MKIGNFDSISRWFPITAVIVLGLLGEVPSSHVPGFCPWFEVLPGYGQVCLSGSPSDFWTAKLECEKLCGHLLMVKTDRDKQVLDMMLRRDEVPLNLSPQVGLWIGGYRNNKTAPLRWVDGTVVDDAAFDNINHTESVCQALLLHKLDQFQEHFRASLRDCYISKHPFICARNNHSAHDCTHSGGPSLACALEVIDTPAYVYVNQNDMTMTTVCKRGHIFPDGSRIKTVSYNSEGWSRSFPPCIAIDQYLNGIRECNASRQINAATLLLREPSVPQDGTPWTPYEPTKCDSSGTCHVDQIKCPPGYTYRRANSCYKAFVGMRPWSDAQNVCSQDGGHLVSLESMSELNHVLDQFRRHSTMFPIPGLRGLWKLGLEHGASDLSGQGFHGRMNNTTYSIGVNGEPEGAIEFLENTTSFVEIMSPDIFSMKSAITLMFQIKPVDDGRVRRHQILLFGDILDVYYLNGSVHFVIKDGAPILLPGVRAAKWTSLALTYDHSTKVLVLWKANNPAVKTSIEVREDDHVPPNGLTRIVLGNGFTVDDERYYGGTTRMHCFQIYDRALGLEDMLYTWELCRSSASDGGLWIGAHEVGGQFRWTSGSLLSDTETNAAAAWSPTAQRGDGGCLLLRPFGFHNVDCQQEQREFICEIEHLDHPLGPAGEVFRTCEDVGSNSNGRWRQVLVQPVDHLPPFTVTCGFDYTTGTFHLSLETDQKWIDIKNAFLSSEVEFSYNESLGLNLHLIPWYKQRSIQCRQYVQAHCSNAVIFGGDYWWKSIQGYHMTDWGGASTNSSTCACAGSESGCNNPLSPCHCDGKGNATDSGFLSDQRYLPLRGVFISGTVNADAVTIYVGPFTCKRVQLHDLGMLLLNSKYITKANNIRASDIGAGAGGVGDVIYSFVVQSTDPVDIIIDLHAEYSFDVNMRLYGGVNPLTFQPLDDRLIVLSDDEGDSLNPRIMARLRGNHTYYIVVSGTVGTLTNRGYFELHLSTSGFNTFKALSEDCLTDAECQKYDAASWCPEQTYRCECRPGFVSDQFSHCRKVLGMDCNNDLDCTSAVYGSTCNADSPLGPICTCKPNWYERENECTPCMCACDATGVCRNKDEDAAHLCHCGTMSQPSAATQGKKDNAGKMFLLSTIDGCTMAGDPDIGVYVQISTDSAIPAHVTITSPLLQSRYRPHLAQDVLQRGKPFTFHLPTEFFCTDLEKAVNGSILVLSTRDVSVSVIIQGPDVAGGYLAIPVDAWGQEYMAACGEYPTYPNRHHEFVVLAIHEKTKVRIQIPQHTPQMPLFQFEGRHYAGHESFEIELSRYQTFHVYQLTRPLTSAYIVSDKPVGLICGSRVIPLAERSPGLSHDMMIEMMPPISTWGQTYVFFLPSTLPDATGMELALLSPRSKTSVLLSDATATYEIQVYEYPQRGILILPLEFDVTDDMGVLIKVSGGNDPGLVVLGGSQGVYKRESQKGGRHLHVLTSLQQSPSRSTFVAGQLESRLGLKSTPYAQHFVKTDNMTLDTSVWRGFPENLVNPAECVINPGVHTLSNEMPQESVEGTLYGTGKRIEYAFPVGALYQETHPCLPSLSSAGDLVDNDCDGSVDEEVVNGLDDDNDGLIDEDVVNHGQPLQEVPPWQITCTRTSRGMLMSLLYDSGTNWSIMKAAGTALQQCLFVRYFPYGTEFRRDILLDDQADRDACGVSVEKEEDSLVYLINVIAQKDPDVVAIGDHSYVVSCIFPPDDSSRVIATASEVGINPLSVRGASGRIGSEQAAIILDIRKQDKNDESLRPDEDVGVGSMIRLEATLVSSGVFQGIRVANCTAYPTDTYSETEKRTVTDQNGCGDGLVIDQGEGFMPLEQSSTKAASPYFPAFKFNDHEVVFFKCVVLLCVFPGAPFCTMPHCHDPNEIPEKWPNYQHLLYKDYRRKRRSEKVLPDLDTSITASAWMTVREKLNKPHALPSKSDNESLSEGPNLNAGRLFKECSVYSIHFFSTVVVILFVVLVFALTVSSLIVRIRKYEMRGRRYVESFRWDRSSRDRIRCVR
ncbi:uncharacterized protein LOC106173434 [Lingula anatina]|uniref:Uncharacterized protein LOC106173434 n=1 Tax=Lingula anatina TaxID=7574 RepID=A0A1S3JJE8_LINAN|nr:uncharacterized protein LOC106173434 [Lingula anatina]|eukprot:XP_013410029.1 uncharacterized protein LOC106173434 [Lingula anatina]